MRIGFLASHNGTAFKEILERNQRNGLGLEPSVLITNNPGAGALDVARRFDVPSFVVNKKTVGEDKIDSTICSLLKQFKTEIVLLAGYMKKIGPDVLAAYPCKILNSHPALLPRFGGQGMYGRKVHEAVIKSKATHSGVTIHFLDAEYDTGPIVWQVSTPVLALDTVETLEQRVKAMEADAYWAALQRIIPSVAPHGRGIPPCSR